MLPARQQLQIMFEFFSETEADIERQLPGFDSETGNTLQMFAEKIVHVHHDIIIYGVGLHVLRSSLHVGENVAGIGFGEEAPHGIAGAGGGEDVIDNAGAGGKGGVCDGHFASIDGNGDFDLRGKILDDRKDAAQFFGLRDRFGAGSSGFAADVENVSSPAPTKARPWATAASVELNRPPSENESGVTFTMPIMRAERGKRN